MSREARATAHVLSDDGTYPNNSRCPVLVYTQAFAVQSPEDLAAEIEQTFAGNGWTKSWRDGVYDFHHYHSTAHEVLGCYRGQANIEIGGERGMTVTLAPGDVIVIPAGVAHRCLQASSGFRVVGAYDAGRTYDMKRGQGNERASSFENMAQVPRPRLDPVYGGEGPLLEHW